MTKLRSASRPQRPGAHRPSVDGQITTSAPHVNRKVCAGHPDIGPETPPGPLFDRADWVRRNGVAFLDGLDGDGPFVVRRLMREPGDEASQIFEVVGPDEACTVGDCGDYYEGSCRQYRSAGLSCRHGEALIRAGLMAEPTSFGLAGEPKGGTR